ncbi:MAG: DUF4097 domain-containing protein [Candidatus Aminicenantes bacterium]|nr:DUF4097 domain-containing protein [Candidatus Aminicenantes bacterium]
MKRSIIIFLLFFACIWLAARDEVIKKRFNTEAGKDVVFDFHDVDGDLLVETHARNEIIFEFVKSINGHPSGRDEDYFAGIVPEITFSTNRLTVKVHYPKRFFFFSFFSHRNIKVRTLVKIPEKSNLAVRLVDGDAEVGGDFKNVSVRTIDGKIKMSGCRAEMDLKTVDGSIEVLRGQGKLRCRTVDGDISAAGVFSSLDFNSVDGDGEFRFLAGSLLQEDCRLHSGDGSIRLAVPKEMPFRLRARSSDGDIDVKVGFERVERQSEHRFEAEKAGANRTIEVSSGDGDIDIKEF